MATPQGAAMACSMPSTSSSNSVQLPHPAPPPLVQPGEDARLLEFAQRGACREVGLPGELPGDGDIDARVIPEPARSVARGATVVHMARDVSIRELRNSTAAVVAELAAGERLTLTVNRRPVADIVPHTEDRDPWVPAAELRRIVRDAPADPGLLDDLADIRGAELND